MEIIYKVFNALNVCPCGEIIIVDRIDVDDGYGILCRDNRRTYIFIKQFSQSIMTYDEMVMKLTDGGDVVGWLQRNGSVSAKIVDCSVRIDGNSYYVGITI